MARKAKTGLDQITTVQLLRCHYFFIAAYIGSIVVFDMWNLIAREAIGRRWLAAGLLLIVNTAAWYVSKLHHKRQGVFQLMLLGVILADIIFVAMNVYWERGMASNSVALFAVPLIMTAALKSRSALIAVASLCSAAYGIAAVGYFFDNYGEGFRVELYGTVGFSVAIFFILAGLLLAITKPPKESP
ncbi:MAG TPA: hypothetical protein VF996_01710 [Candidatus Saccharimonadales bacterium]|jgi:hypothetical protein